MAMREAVIGAAVLIAGGGVWWFWGQGVFEGSGNVVLRPGTVVALTDTTGSLGKFKFKPGQKFCAKPIGTHGVALNLEVQQGRITRSFITGNKPGMFAPTPPPVVRITPGIDDYCAYAATMGTRAQLRAAYANSKAGATP